MKQSSSQIHKKECVSHCNNSDSIPDYIRLICGANGFYSFGKVILDRKQLKVFGFLRNLYLACIIKSTAYSLELAYHSCLSILEFH